MFITTVVIIICNNIGNNVFITIVVFLISWLHLVITAWKMSKYGVISVPYFPAFGLNTKYLSVFSTNAGKYGPEITPYFGHFSCSV